MFSMVKPGSSTGHTDATRSSGTPAAGAQGQAQHEVAAQRVTRGHEWELRPALGDVARGMHHFVDQVGVEDAGVEMMGIAVVAEVQPYHVEALLEHARGRHAHVAGFGAAFPAVQQQRHALGLAAFDMAVPALQAHAIAAIENQLFADRAGRSQQQQAALQAHAAGAEHRLQVRVAQPARRLVVSRVQRRRAGVQDGWRDQGHRTLTRCSWPPRCARATSPRCADGLPGPAHRWVPGNALPHAAPARRAGAGNGEALAGAEGDNGLRIAVGPVHQRHRLHRHAGFHRSLEDARMERANFVAPRVRPSGNTPTALPSRRRSAITCITPPSDSVLPRWWKMVWPRAASHPTSGQLAISRLATKPIMRWLCRMQMSTQLTWLATNSTAPGSGVPICTRRKPKIHISPLPPVDHFGPRVASPTRSSPHGRSMPIRMSGRNTMMWTNSSGTRYR